MRPKEEARLAAAEAEVRELWAALAELRGQVETLKRRERGPSREAVRVLLLLPARWGGDAFSTNEVMERARAQEDVEMQEALANAGVTKPHQLAKVFALLEDRTFSGFRLKRIGSERDGITWVVLRD